MASTNHIKTIALIGATGNVGSQILASLLAVKDRDFKITIITRSDSEAVLPAETENNPSTTVKRGAYSDTDFLSEAFKGIDAAIFALSFMAMDSQKLMIEAAVKAGVAWILPTEYAGDGANEAMVNRVPVFWPKREARNQITAFSAENSGKVKFVGVVTNPWVPFSLQTGMFGIDLFEKTVTFYEDAGSFNVSTLEGVGTGVAALLSLPIENKEDERRSLEHYENAFVYLSSALTTQREMFDAALMATGTSEAEWTISRSTCAERLRVAEEKFKQGDFWAGADGTYAVYMGEGMGGDYESKAKEDREVLGLEQTESMERIVRQAVKMGPFRVM